MELLDIVSMSILYIDELNCGFDGNKWENHRTKWLILWQNIFDFPRVPVSSHPGKKDLLSEFTIQKVRIMIQSFKMIIDLQDAILFIMHC